MYKWASVVGVSLFVLVGFITFYGGTTPIETVADSADSGRVLPVPDQPIRYKLRTRTTYVDEKDTKTIQQEFAVDFKPPDQFYITSNGNHSEFIENKDHDLTIKMRTDGSRFRVDRGGEIFIAGKLDSGPGKFLSRMPGGNSYLLSALLQRNPFDTTVQIREKQGMHIYTDGQQRAYFDREGHLLNARGATRWIEQRTKPYYKRVIYGETVTKIRENMSFSPDHFQVDKRVIRAAQGETGTIFPNHRYKTLTGKTVRIFDREGPYLINRWATWCPPCIFEIPHLNEIHHGLGDRVTIIGVTGEDIGPIREFLSRDQNIDYTILRQPGRAPVPYSSFQTLPFTFLVDKNRVLQAVVRGARSKKQWKALIEEHLLK